MRRYIILLMLFIASAGSAQVREWHVKPYGFPNNQAGGDGTSLNTAWSLQNAFNNPGGLIQPGDIIWLHGGEYLGRFVSNLQGGLNGDGSPKYIIVSSYPGEWAVLNGNTQPYVAENNPSACSDPCPTCMPNPENTEMMAPGPDEMASYLDDGVDDPDAAILSIPNGLVQYQNFEVSCVGPVDRIRDDLYPNNGTHRFPGINHTPPNLPNQKIKLVNLVVKNIPGTGIGSWKYAEDSEIYGCLIYNNGYTFFNRYGTLNSNGHFRIFGKSPGIYTQNASNKMRKIKNNIISNNFDSGMLIWSASEAPTFNYVQNYNVDRNIVFNNGNPSRAHYETEPSWAADSKPNIVIDSYSGNAFNHPTNINLRGNVFYDEQLSFISGVRAHGNDITLEFNDCYKGTVGHSFMTNNNNLSYDHNMYFGKYIGIGVTPAEYISKAWYMDLNQYYKWDENLNKWYQPFSGGWLSNTQFVGQYSPAESLTTFNTNHGGNGVLYFNYAPPFSRRTKIAQNEYNPNLFYISVFNATTNVSSANEVVNLSSYPIPAGKSYRLRDAQNYSAAPVTGVYNGSTVSLPFTSDPTKLERPTGYVPTPCFENRRLDFTVYTVEFYCEGLAFDLNIHDVTDISAITYKAKNNMVFGTNYVANTVRSDVTAKAGKSIVIAKNSYVGSGAKLWAVIENQCPDALYIGEPAENYGRPAAHNEPVSKDAGGTERFIIYPNPSSGLFAVQSVDSLKITHIEIASISDAASVYSIACSDTSASVDITARKSGIYTIKVTFEDGTVAVKTIIKN